MIDTNVMRSNWPHLAAYADEIDRLRAEVATARALAFEEASNWHEDMIDHDDPDLHRLNELHIEASHALLALAPLPASLVAVPRETLSEATRAWTFFFAFLDRERLLSDWPDCLADIIEAREALSALLKEKR